MTYREKLLKERPDRVGDWFTGGCFSCPGAYWPDAPEPQHGGNCDISGGHDGMVCRACWDREIPEQTGTMHDPVNHPSHYCRDGAMESIDEMRLIFGDEVVMHFCLCNAWKYRYRAADKNGAEDMAKSDWYIKKYKELKKR